MVRHLIFLNLAWRFQRRHLRTFLLMGFASALVTCVLILWSLLTGGFYEHLQRAATDYETAEIQIRPAALEEDLWETVPANLAETPDFASIILAPRWRAGAIAYHEEQDFALQLIGVEPEQERQVTKLMDHLAVGLPLRSSNDLEVLVGSKLAQKAHLRIGNSFLIIAQTTQGFMSAKTFVVRGILRPIAAGFDETSLLMSSATLRQFLSLSESPHLYVGKRNSADVSLAQLQSRLSPLRLISWEDLKPTLSQTIKLLTVTIYLTLIIAFGALGSLILNATFMAISDRSYEFGLMRALGFRDQELRKILRYEAFTLVVFATASALALALPLALWWARSGLDFSFATTKLNFATVVLEPVILPKISVKGFLAPILALNVSILGFSELAVRRALKPAIAESMRRTF